MRDLLEGSEIHVQMLAYRVLAQDDDRARRLAADMLDILLGTLLRPLHRKTRLAAFGALANAAKADATAAARALRRVCDALRLPDTKYPKEQLVGLIGGILHTWPELRGSARAASRLRSAGGGSMIVLVDYASPSVFDSTRDAASLSLATNARRPVRFQGVVRQHGFNLRIALQALGAAIWSDDTWVAGSDLLDPIITVHPDRIFFEAFSQDCSVYAALIVDPAIFETEAEVVTGTTNIDFTAWLWGVLGEMRTGRHTTLRVGPEGFEVRTSGAGGRFERKVDVPESWVRGFLQVQAAMGMPGTRLDIQPIDLLAALRFLRYSKAKVSPRALRYEFEPGQDARLVLEPWEHVVPLAGAAHHYTERKVTRVWGRRRLKLVEGLLPFAESVQVYLKGRALPSFYAVQLAGMTFVLGLSGFSEAGFTGTGGFDLLSDAAATDDGVLGPTLDLLRRQFHRSAPEVAQTLGIDEISATQLLGRLCRQGRCMFDVETRRYRHRELFEQPADELKYFPPDLRAS